MQAREAKHPAATAAGALALALWAIYLLLALKALPDLPYRVQIAGFFGLLACVGVIFKFKYWRGGIILSVLVYLATYVVLIGRMATMVTGSGASLLSAVGFYYTNSWVVTQGTFHERGVLDGVAHLFLEYGMPVLSLVLLIVALMSRRTPNRY